MTIKEFRQSIFIEYPPIGLSEPLCVMWYSQKGDWDKAHNIAQDISNELGSWIHAHLHRVEGDISNAGYWYRKANRPPHSGSTETEAEEIIQYIIQKEREVV